MDKKIIGTRLVGTENQLTDLSIKPLGKPQVEFICSKLGMYKCILLLVGEC